jgi:deoxyribodipyrimidine photo-lyase
MTEPTPDIRIRSLNDRDLRSDGKFICYWMNAFRRPVWNFSLQHAAELAHKLGKPLLVVEALGCDYRWASDRFHHFLIGGMLQNYEYFAARDVMYYPYVEPKRGAGKGFIRQLSQAACAVVGDDYPAFFLPRIMQAAARRSPVALLAVDANGLLPIHATDHLYKRAYTFRRYLQQELPNHLADFPLADPLDEIPGSQASVPQAIRDRWPRATKAELQRWSSSRHDSLSTLPIDHSVGPTGAQGGYLAARKALDDFLNHKLDQYGTDHNHPDAAATSRMSHYLHFGYISTHEIVAKILDREDWNPSRLGQATGQRNGWWGLSEAVESYLDQLITWREIGLNACVNSDDHEHYESIPQWAKQTLAEHADDAREFTYGLPEFENAQTHDPLWNAAQRQLLTEGYIHNYLRMLWGKKILHWSASPQEAFVIMVELNNKYALDGRDPNSYSGILWCLGKYDRAWGPEREIFGKVRYMTSDSTRKKLRLKEYLQQYDASPE